MEVKNKKTYYQIILDNSGSMYDCVESTVNGFNKQMQMIKSLESKFPDQEVLVSLTTFNQHVSFQIECSKPHDLKEMISERNYSEKLDFLIEENLNKKFVVYSPNGMTSLYDAIGSSIENIQNVAKKEIEEDIATIVVVIITDGHENSSKIFTYSQIQSMIKELEKSDNWTFSYLSNTPDAVDYATKMNIKQENSFRYNKDDMYGAHSGLAFSMDSYMDKKSKNIKDQQFYKFKRK